MDLGLNTYRPPVSLASALGLASAAAHAHYVNGMVSGGSGRIGSDGQVHHHPAAALQAAVAAAAAASAAVAQRSKVERDEATDRDRGKNANLGDF